MFDFGKCDKGNVAIVFALSLLPTLGMVGAAVDYGRATSAKEHMRSLSDQTALTIASANIGRPDALLAATKAAVKARYGDEIESVSVTGAWLDDRHYSLQISAALRTSILAAVPGMPQQIAAHVETVTRRLPPTFQTLPPRSMLLEPEAADYNRVYMYCFNPDRINDADRGRRGLAPIADNAHPAPRDYSTVTKPICTSGEVQSYMLRNVRGARRDSWKYDDRNQEVYEYFADTRIEPATQRLIHTIEGFRVFNGTTRTRLDMNASPILETVLCANDDECRTRSQGGVIPDRRTDRSPNTATGACLPGRYMYFGWEDRPPGLGWTDRDYDDIRLVVSCPVPDETAPREVTIVR